MFGKVKRYLGIEGVKIDVELPDEVRKSSGKINGKLILTSMNNQTVNLVKLRLIERYSRGRKQEKKIDEYELGQIELQHDIFVRMDEPVEINFALPYEFIHSEVDEFGNKNLLNKNIAKLAKYLYSAKSDYFILAEAKVKGMGLNPFKKEMVNFI